MASEAKCGGLDESGEAKAQNKPWEGNGGPGRGRKKRLGREGRYVERCRQGRGGKWRCKEGRKERRIENKSNEGRKRKKGD